MRKNIKKVITTLLISSALALVACSESDSSSLSYTPTLTPPDWIQGTWACTGVGTYAFTSNTVVQESSDGNVDFEQITKTNNGVITETETNTYYLLEDVKMGDTTMDYKFLKSDGTKIVLELNSITINCPKQ
jgi:hypothetical protein